MTGVAWGWLVSRCSPFEVRLSVEDRAVLEGRVSSRVAAYGEVVRARIVLLAAAGERNVDIAGRVGVCVDTVLKWRKRFCEEGLAGLRDRPRSGRPRRFGSEVVAGIKALACEPPEQRHVPLSRWTSVELAAQAVSEGLVESISSSTVRRCLPLLPGVRPVHGSCRTCSSASYGVGGGVAVVAKSTAVVGGAGR